MRPGGGLVGVKCSGDPVWTAQQSAGFSGIGRAQLCFAVPIATGEPWCLCGGDWDDGCADTEDAQAVNTLLIAANRRYYLARELRRCPL
jgi:hypothetical protein